jgi:acetyl-CoA carboxylase biotin carboxyl carrier protein
VRADSRRPASEEAAELIALLDRLEAVLADSELTELEVEVGETALLLRKPGAVNVGVGNGAAPMAHDVVPATAAAADAGEEPSPYHQVLAPLTGIYYGSPSPGAAPYVRVGAEVNEGQVVGLIEAMKLFNEIKSDVRGRVVRIVAENGALIKARQPLIEVMPA